MKGLIKKCLLCGLASVMVFCTTACNSSLFGKEKHEHEYSWYLVKVPTCSKAGLMEGICECGEKTYNDLQATGHDYINGVCGVCGQKEEDTLQKVEPNQVVGLTLSGVYEKYKNFEDCTFETFKNNLSGNYLSNLKIDALGVLHCVYEYGSEFSADIILPSMKVDFELPETTNLKNILKIGFEDNNFVCTLVDGTYIEIGEIEGMTLSPQKFVRSIFINKENQLGVVFSDDTVKVIGKIADVGTAINGAQLTYKKIDGKQEYKVWSWVDDDTTKIEIPATHCGLPVTEIADYAFKDNKKITEIVFSENMKSVGRYAFSGCSELITVKFNQGLREIENFAFSECGKLQRVIIPSAVETCAISAFYGTNCTIYVDIETKPSGWDANWSGDNNRIYWKGEWELINGVPTPKN